MAHCQHTAVTSSRSRHACLFISGRRRCWALPGRTGSSSGPGTIVKGLRYGWRCGCGVEGLDAAGIVLLVVAGCSANRPQLGRTRQDPVSRFMIIISSVGEWDEGSRRRRPAGGQSAPSGRPSPMTFPSRSTGVDGQVLWLYEFVALRRRTYPPPPWPARPG